MRHRCYHPAAPAENILLGSPSNTTELHVFENHGLGKAPYVFLGVETRVGPVEIPGEPGHFVGAPGQPMGVCQFCSTGILYLFWLRSADGKIFYVGSDCIYKSGDAGLRSIIEPIVQAHQKELRDERNVLLVAQFTKLLEERPNFYAEVYSDKPHPYDWYAKQGKTLADYNQLLWQRARWSQSKKATLARQFLKDAGIALPKINHARATTTLSKKMWKLIDFPYDATRVSKSRIRR